MNGVVSPLTGTGAVTLLYTVDVNKLAADYLRIFGIDIGVHLHGVRLIDVYRCDRTGYRFYHPFDLCGDSAFYAQLEKHPWYYMDTKWEHDEALHAVRSGDRILEIGAARGAFLLRAQAIAHVRCQGLELNQVAAATARGKGLDVAVETAEEHAVRHASHYDMICLFQVLEHIPQPASVLTAALQMLKPGGRLIVAVPDNSDRATQSLFVAPDNILNMPPHHLGLWNSASLCALTGLYPLLLERLIAEPAAAGYQQSAYRALIKEDLRKRYGIWGFLYYAAVRSVLIGAIERLSGYLPAHTILAIYRKQD